MITFVDTVLIGNAVPATYTTADALAKGDVALFDENGKIITSEDAAKAAKSVKIGVVTGTTTITNEDGTTSNLNIVEYSNSIQKAMLKSYVPFDYKAPTQEVITVDYTGTTPVVGERYAIKILYKDLSDTGIQFSKTYDVFAATTSPADLATALMKSINKDAGRRVTATVSGAVLTLTALAKDDNEGTDSLNEYSIVDMEVSAYKTIPSIPFGQFPMAFGVVTTTTVGDSGKGYWKQVRDQELRNMGYKGMVYTGAYPSIEQSRKVTAGTQYNGIVLMYENLYKSNDNQYVKTTPIMTELYVSNGTTATLIGSSIDTFLKAFFGLA